MDDDILASQFEANRKHLKKIAFRMLGSRAAAEDAVQEAWLRLSRSDTDEIRNLGGWLTTVVARICLDVLRSRGLRREDRVELKALESVVDVREGSDPEFDVALADSVGLALLVVLETLAPAERVAFVLHDLFDLSFEEIAPILDKSPAATRKLTSRARQRFRGTSRMPTSDLMQRRRVVDAYLAAARDGDFEGLLAVLDPSVVLRADRPMMPGAPRLEIRGAELVARQAITGRTDAAVPMLVDGMPGIAVAPGGRLLLALKMLIVDDRVTEIDVVVDPLRLQHLKLAVF
jgi:RNA polymerase sigma-70 factor (ECF subfamily)